MIKKKLLVVLLLPQICAVTSITPAQAGSALGDWPLAIVCERETVKRVGYLAEIRDDGSAIYLSVDGRRTVTVTAEGILQPGIGMQPDNNCVGKTIEDLRSSGQVIVGR